MYTSTVRCSPVLTTIFYDFRAGLPNQTDMKVGVEIKPSIRIVNITPNNDTYDHPQRLELGGRSKKNETIFRFFSLEQRNKAKPHSLTQLIYQTLGSEQRPTVLVLE
jgi:hypothetical protein